MYDKYRDAYAQRNTFLQIWGDIDKIKNMSLEDYTDIKNANNFTYWIETRTQACGTIKGTWATKAGIYGKASARKLSKRQYFDDGKYAWYRSLGEDRAEAFKIVREKITTVVESTLNDKLEKISEVTTIWPVFKWKIAFLYYNHNKGIKLLPIYTKRILAKFLNESSSKSMLELYKIAIERYDIKDLDTAFDLVREIFNPNKKYEKNNYQAIENYQNRSPNLTSQSFRKAKILPEKELSQRHKEISESLERYLTKKNKDSKIFRETQYIDMVLITLDKKIYYEIKTHSKVIYCLREAIGQLLQYCYYQKADTYPFADELIIIGEPIPNKYDVKYLQMLRKKYNLNLFYQYFDPEKMFLSNKY